MEFEEFLSYFYFQWREHSKKVATISGGGSGHEPFAIGKTLKFII